MENDRRLALEEAFDSAEADAKGETYVPPVREDSPDTEVEAKDSNFVKLVSETDEAGQQEQKAADAKPKADRPRTKGVPPDQRTGKAPAVKAETPPTEGEPAAQPQSNLDKPPVGWGANRDALWAKTPADVRGLISRRESEIQRGMSDAGRSKAIAAEYASVIQPFGQTIARLGSNPREALTEVMKTATMLIEGSQETKASIVTEMILNYGIDLGGLDKILTAALQAKQEGKPMPWMKNVPQARQPQAPIDPRLAKMLDRYEAAERSHDEELKQEAATAMASMVNVPHFEEVRHDMADIMELSAKRGKVLTIQQAYQKAVQLNPEISAIVATKTQKTDVSKAASTLAKARRASSSVSGAPGSAALGSRATDRRSALEEAYDAQG